MSEVQGPNPFVTTTTPTIERANRLMSLRANPGFLDLLRIAQEIEKEAADYCADYPGWDAQQIVILKVRMQVAKEFREALLGRVNRAIEDGIAESRQNPAMSAQTAEDAINHGDFVRQRVLETFSENDLRAAGSY